MPFSPVSKTTSLALVLDQVRVQSPRSGRPRSTIRRGAIGSRGTFIAPAPLRMKLAMRSSTQTPAAARLRDRDHGVGRWRWPAGQRRRDQRQRAAEDRGACSAHLGAAGKLTTMVGVAISLRARGRRERVCADQRRLVELAAWANALACMCSHRGSAPTAPRTGIEDALAAAAVQPQQLGGALGERRRRVTRTRMTRSAVATTTIGHQQRRPRKPRPSDLCKACLLFFSVPGVIVRLPRRVAEPRQVRDIHWKAEAPLGGCMLCSPGAAKAA